MPRYPAKNPFDKRCPSTLNEQHSSFCCTKQAYLPGTANVREDEGEAGKEERGLSMVAADMCRRFLVTGKDAATLISAAHLQETGFSCLR
jgi:hypothetical protein